MWIIALRDNNIKLQVNQVGYACSFYGTFSTKEEAEESLVKLCEESDDSEWWIIQLRKPE